MEKVELELFVADAGGANSRQITSGSFQDSRPAFSPDGKEIVFLSNRDGRGRGLYIVSPDGSGEPRRILSDYGVARPVLPDGKFIYSHTPEPTLLKNTFGTADPCWRWPEGAYYAGQLRNSQGAFVDFGGVHLWFHSAPRRGAFRFNLQTRELVPMTPPGFSAAWHVSRSRNGIVAFDSDQLAPSARP